MINEENPKWGFLLSSFPKIRKPPPPIPIFQTILYINPHSTAKPLAPFLLEGSSPFEMDHYLESYSPRNDPMTAVES